MKNVIYVLCALTSLSCAVLLLRGYGRSKVRLLLWSGLCFAFLALNNLLLVIDLTILTQVDLSVIRSIPTMIGLSLLIFGFIWDERTQL
ncbi:MAG: DUF5985 family protein [Bacteroidota bacterium]|nr:DUF5985 family protein [Bacteroidota bacterium]MDP4234341.1 DUF5985 family protein [Bacteroidota bacterium]MDP4243275.1 DUF5985 family protein [Bacteroidota bacterium]MDP4289100.1 DUF5985 family protein [Bacteroidota bacterium]